MSLELLTWVFGAGVAQGLFLVVSLATLKVRNSRARWLLVAILAIFTLLLGEEFVERAGWPSGLGLGLAVEFAIWPLLLLFVAALAEDGPPDPQSWRHFLPTIAAALFLTYLHVAFDGGVSLSNPPMRDLVAGVVLAKILVFAIYAPFVLQRPLELAAKPDATRRALRWVRGWIWVVCAAYAVLAVAFATFYLQVEGAIDSDLIGGAVLVAAIYGLGYFALANRNVFDVQAERIVSKRDGGDLLQLAAVAIERITTTQEYLDADLGLRDLADSLGVGETKLSRALNQQVEGGFYAIVNKLRLEVFCDLLKDSRRRDDNILELALEAGFGSKATMYRLFKAREGITPTQYRDKHVAEGLVASDETSFGAKQAAI